MIQELYEYAANLFARKTEYSNREIQGKDHPKTLAYMNGLAVLRTKLKQYDEAELLFDMTLESRDRRLGEKHPETLESKNDLAVLYKEQGRYDDAERLLPEAAISRRLRLGDTRPHTLES